MASVDRYRECFVAFLDIIGFRQLVESAANDAGLLSRLSGITALAATPKSGVKQTSLGPCPMQVRAFSDSIVVFTPTRHENDNACNPLAQLCFVVRHLHDQILRLQANIRGGITIGGMYWHPNWSDTASSPKRGTRGALPITFGPGLNSAYDLESKYAVNPRVLVDESVQNAAAQDQPTGWPFANHGSALRDFFRIDPTDGRLFLDLLNHRVVRHEVETMHTSAGGFTVTWASGEVDSHRPVVRRIQALAEAGIAENAECEHRRKKHEWLLAYAHASAAQQ